MSERENDVRTGTLVGGLAWWRGRSLEPPVRKLLEAKNVCIVSTIGANGSIHAIPVWVDTDGDHVLLNSVAGRTWVKNLERDPRVTCTVVQSGNLYEFVEIRGRVLLLTHEGAEEHIHRLAKKYLDLDVYPWLRPEDPRVLFVIEPERVFHMQPGAAELEVTDQ